MNLENQQPINDCQNGSFKAFGAFFWDLLKIFIIALVIIVPFRMFIAEPFVVSGSSMVPNFHNGDYLIVDRLTYHFSQPQRGDVIVLRFPKDTSQFFIKRIIGLPGETICFPQGHVLISPKPITADQCRQGDGTVLDEPYLPSQMETLANADPVTLGSGEYFVLGDNRMASSDSRIWGILPVNDIVGRVFVRVIPFSSAQLFHPVSY